MVPADLTYHRLRRENRAHAYRLARRTAEVARALSRHAGNCRRILDLGTADGLMPAMLRKQFPGTRFLGVDLSFDLLAVQTPSGIDKVQADVMRLPVKSGTADAVIATAVIEHVASPLLLLQECLRVLVPGGVLVLTTPVPWLEKLASAVGLLHEEGHQETLDRPALFSLTEEAGLTLLEYRRFMLSPIGFPGEKLIERLLGPLGLKFFMANQILAARRTS